MSQTTLTDTAPFTLDSTCSDKKIWPKFASIRIDIRREVKPDIVASACYLPFRSDLFDKIYCDPPHIIDAKGLPTPKVGAWFASVNRHRGFYGQNWLNCLARFGYWKSQDEWFQFIEKTDIEFARCLKGTGSLEYKIMSRSGKKFAASQDLSRMSHFETVQTKQTNSKSHNPVHWLTMKPKPEAVISPLEIH